MLFFRNLALTAMVVLSLASSLPSFAHGEAGVVLGLLTTTELTLLTVSCGLYNSHSHHMRRHGEFQKLRESAHDFLADGEGVLSASLREQLVGFEKVIQADSGQNLSDEERVRRFLSGLNVIENHTCESKTDLKKSNKSTFVGKKS